MNALRCPPIETLDIVDSFSLTLTAPLGPKPAQHLASGLYGRPRLTNLPSSRDSVRGETGTISRASAWAWSSVRSTRRDLARAAGVVDELSLRSFDTVRARDTSGASRGVFRPVAPPLVHC